MYRTERFHLALLIALLFLIASVLPYAAYAKEDVDVRAAIKSELMNDPRTQGFSQAQLDAMITVLAEAAQKNSLTAGDITWRPQDPTTFAAQNDASEEAGMNSSTCNSSGLLCLFGEAFGFIGSDATIPFILGVSSMALIWVCAEMLNRRRTRMRGE